MSITAALEQVAEEARAAGAVATLSPGQVPVLLSQSGPVLLIGAPEVTTVGLSGRFALDIPLLLFLQPPGNWPNVARGLEVLQQLLMLFPGAWRPTLAEVGDIALPAYASTVGRKTDG